MPVVRKKAVENSIQQCNVHRALTPSERSAAIEKIPHRKKKKKEKEKRKEKVKKSSLAAQLL